jgi:hypothetical protein
MPQVVLSQYRDGSRYKDELGISYHFPKRYLSRIGRPETEFIYYEPRNGGQQVYFGYGRIGEIWPDPEEKGSYFAEVLGFQPFRRDVSYWNKVGNSREPAKAMRNSVRPIPDSAFTEILATGGLEFDNAIPRMDAADELEQLYASAIPALKRSIAARYERPNAITNAVKRSRGSTCQVCSKKGFLMRNGKEYCEIHHLFHLAKQLPGTLGSKYLVVVCADCHRKLHYADCTEPEEINNCWRFFLARTEIMIPASVSVSSK